MFVADVAQRATTIRTPLGTSRVHPDSLVIGILAEGAIALSVTLSGGAKCVT